MIEAQISVDSILPQIKQKKLLIVNPRRKNGLILYKRYYAEFAGPGAVIGSEFDEEKINAYLIRRQSHSSPTCAGYFKSI